ncbi:MAG: alkaline phosphatase family protein [bacterium]
MSKLYSLFKKSLKLGGIFGVLSGILVGVLAFQINHFSFEFKNIFLVPFYHVLIYSTVGLLVGAVGGLLVAGTAKFISMDSSRTNPFLSKLLTLAFSLIFILFAARLFWSFPAQKEQTKIKFDPLSVNSMHVKKGNLLQNTDSFIGVQPHFKTIVIALDAASFSVMDSLILEGHLPTIKSLLQNGVRAKVKTLTPTRSPVIWTSIATGKLPAEHGIWDFVLGKMPGTSFTRGRYKYPYASGMERFASFFSDIAFIPNIPYTSNLRQVKAFWNILSEYKRRIGVIGWYATFPVEPVTGFMISDGLFFSTRYLDEKIRTTLTFPPDLIDEIESVVIDSTEITPDQLIAKLHISPTTWQKIQQSRYFENISYLLKLTYSRDERTLALTQKLLVSDEFKNLDLLTVYFKSIDEVSHATCEEYRGELAAHDADNQICRENLLAVYQQADARIAEVLKFADENTAVMILSDHGFSYGDITGESKFGHWQGQEGVFILSGPHIKKNYDLSEIAIFDFLPTLLYMQNMPVAIDLKGQVLLSAFEDDFIDTHPVRYISSFERQSEHSDKPVQTNINKEIEKKLKSLGYIN